MGRRVNMRNTEGYMDLTVHDALLRVLKQQKQKYRPLVYICTDETAMNKATVLKLRICCRWVVKHDGIPIAPGLYFPQFMSVTTSADQELQARFRKILLDLCEELWVFGEPSDGMKAEIARAQRKQKCVRFISHPKD